MKKIYASKPLICGALSLVSLFAFAKPEKVIQIFRNGEVIQQYGVSEIDYIEVNEISELEGSEYEYTVKDKDISKSGVFGTGFYYKNFWDDGITLNYSVSDVKYFQQLGNSMNIEIYAGSKALYDGQEFNVAETDLPFSFKFEYVDVSISNTVTVTIDNENREGASGTIALKRNDKGSYDAIFDLTLESGNITVKGYYAGELQDPNKIYTTTEGNVATVKSATLDMTGETYVLYFSSKEGEAGPDNYDIKGEVSAKEWKYDIFMSFSGQDSKVIWLDGETYDKTTTETSSVFGGNWRVMTPITVEGDKKVAECTATLFGSEIRNVYYYGEIKIIE